MSDQQTMPGERAGLTKKFSILHKNKLGQPEPFKFYVSFSTYPDGRCGEIFIKGDKVDPVLAGMLDGIAIMTSVALQHGASVDNVIDKLRHLRFEPCGFTGDENFPSCSSLLDLIAQYLDRSFPKPWRLFCSDPAMHKIAFANNEGACLSCVERYKNWKPMP